MMIGLLWPTASLSVERHDNYEWKKGDYVTAAVICPKEEDILTSRNLIQKGIVLDKLMESVIIQEGVTLDDLLLGDKNAIMIASEFTLNCKSHSGNEIFMLKSISSPTKGVISIIIVITNIVLCLEMETNLKSKLVR